MRNCTMHNEYRKVFKIAFYLALTSYAIFIRIYIYTEKVPTPLNRVGTFLRKVKILT